ncbi:MAG: phenylalanine--tRNA ligase subunit alpha [Candidatus Aenigmarchaeota archaeon]|nr:phenylalanine--tRNA ligase subunit alpha [Candidatus Aenigmarchaeota archaeon]
MIAKYRLTEEGKGYLKEGLPEKNLVKLLSYLKKPVTLEEANKKIKNFHIALKWAIEKGWVKKEDKKLILVKIPKKIEEQEALEKIAKEEEVSESLLNILIQRKLVEKISAEVEKTKKLVGKEVLHLTPELIKTGLWKKVKFKPYNVEAVGKKIYAGKRHPYNQFLILIRQKLVELGFKEMKGPTIETEFWNFDALYQAQDHPSRDWAMTYQLKKPKFGKLPEKRIVENVRKAHEVGVSRSIGWQYRWDPRKAMQLMPRAHGTCLSARTLAYEPEIPGKYFAIVRCYRPDVIDAMHAIEFNQLEGIAIDESLNFRNLLGILEMLAKEIAEAKEVRFIPDYYPFTECSTQLSCKHPQLGWIELGGAGMFREEVTYPLGIKAPVLAWGLGIDRLAMFKIGIDDIRNLFSRDLEWLRSQKVIL